ncbi:Ba23 [Baboon cytomegalovirus]|nr:Ba23 [Baboon cytomegalovirus]
MVLPCISTTRVSLICIMFLFVSIHCDVFTAKPLECKPVNGTAGHNVTMSPPSFNYHTTYVYWYRGSGKARKELCRYVPQQTQANARIKFSCLSNYSLLLINVTAHMYNGNYTVKLDFGSGRLSETCYKLTVRNVLRKVPTTTRKTTTVTTTATTTEHTTYTIEYPTITLPSETAPFIALWENQTSYAQIQNHSALHAMWIFLLVIIIVLLCFFCMRLKNKHKPCSTVLTPMVQSPEPPDQYF